MSGGTPESLAEVFWNQPSDRLRAPWRILGLLVVLAVLVLAVGIAGAILVEVVESVLIGVLPDVETIFLGQTVVTIALPATVVIGAVYVAARFLDRRRFRDLGLRVDADWWLDLLFGLALGAALMSGIFLVEYGAGLVTVTGTFRIEGTAASAFWPWFAASVALWLSVGFYEELLTRGYLVVNLAEGLTWSDRLGARSTVWLAAGTSALVFAVLHAANSNASLAGVAGIFVAGVMLAAGYVLTGELAIPIGIHVTWNLFQGSVFGFPVSGMGLNASLVAVEQDGPTWLTGGQFGPEAGLLGVAASVVGLGLIAVWVWRREGRLRVAPSLSVPDLRT